MSKCFCRLGKLLWRGNNTAIAACDCRVSSVIDWADANMVFGASVRLKLD